MYSLIHSFKKVGVGPKLEFLSLRASSLMGIWKHRGAGLHRCIGFRSVPCFWFLPLPTVYGLGVPMKGAAWAFHSPTPCLPPKTVPMPEWLMAYTVMSLFAIKFFGSNCKYQYSFYIFKNQNRFAIWFYFKVKWNLLFSQFLRLP